MAIEFNYETKSAIGITTGNLLEWIADLHGELTDLGLLPGNGDEGISDETHNQLMVLAKLAED